MVNLTNFVGFFIPQKTCFADLSWVLQVMSVSILAFVSIFRYDMVDFDPKLPFQVWDPTKIGPRLNSEFDPLFRISDPPKNTCHGFELGSSANAC